ncbi:type-2 restriction enzyme MjaIII [Striga asiatica]|uniref:Type-2 restriction enzyme MjaIII n=1 Tax=Striga asiatica TaxID=4170 RepID=A0A5A7QZW5_STRAF|nr:type-2 restriction enzyme MjaIII [Striga asiatica]
MAAAANCGDGIDIIGGAVRGEGGPFVEMAAAVSRRRGSWCRFISRWLRLGWCQRQRYTVALAVNPSASAAEYGVYGEAHGGRIRCLRQIEFVCACVIDRERKENEWEEREKRINGMEMVCGAHNVNCQSEYFTLLPFYPRV